MGGKLTFKHENLKGLLIHAMAQWPLELRPLYKEKNVEPGFWVVGDQGVYLMHNGKCHDVPEGETQPVVYAEECNPHGDFDDWWEVKRRVFGGDDGSDFVDRRVVEDCVRNGEDLEIEFTANSMKMIGVKPKRR